MKAFVEVGNVKIPTVGYGMWQSDTPEELEKALDIALDAGYRHFDTAWGYRNEAVFGKVLKRWFDNGKVQRHDLFITTKLPPTGNHPDRVQKFLDDSLNALQLDYVDLFLIHNPATLKPGPDGFLALREANNHVVIDTSGTLEGVWEVMEAQVKAGKTKAIGLSNFSIPQVERIVACANIKPANHQIELNAYYPRKAMREVCKKHGISVCAFAPLGSPGRKVYKGYTSTNAHLQVNIPPLLDDPIVNQIAKKHGKTPAQILLRFLGQLGIITLAKSVNPDRIKSNFDVLSFSLDDGDMSKLHTLDQGVEGGTWGFDWKNAYPSIETHPEFQLEG